MIPGLHSASTVVRAHSSPRLRSFGNAEHTWTGGRETGAAREPPSDRVPGPCALRRQAPARSE